MENLEEYFFQKELVTNPSRSYSLKMINRTASTLLLLESLNNVLVIFNKDQTLPWCLAPSLILPINSRETVKWEAAQRWSRDLGCGIILLAIPTH